MAGLAYEKLAAPAPSEGPKGQHPFIDDDGRSRSVTAPSSASTSSASTALISDAGLYSARACKAGVGDRS